MMTLPVAYKKTSVKGMLRYPVMQLLRPDHTNPPQQLILSIATHETAIGNKFHYNDVKQTCCWLLVCHFCHKMFEASS